MSALPGPVMIAAGGTGGHVMPALAVARELHERGVDVTWVGTARGLESRLVPAAGIVIDWLSVEGIRGKGVLSLLLAPINILRACTQAWRIMRERRPIAVLGMGGFVAGPAGLVAWLTRRPLIIHEQNAIAGVTNRLLRPLATRALQAVPDALADTAMTVGNPVRREIAEAQTPQTRFAERSVPVRLLVLGGSQGSRALNEVLPAALATVNTEVSVTHQCGKGHLAATASRYGSNPNVAVSEFIDSIGTAMEEADLVVCRSGAMTVAELCSVGVGSILVPFPFAVDDHQSANAKPLVETDAALLRQESDLTPQWLSDRLNDLLSDRVRLLEMAVAARNLAKPNAAIDVAEVVLEVSR
ncbi:MAG: undecaprenyldiphospho-muramoylpentapeptide beta-N-acetylglucosaminyltransferase [Pseudomonadota bacterium]